MQFVLRLWSRVTILYKKTVLSVRLPGADQAHHDSAQATVHPRNPPSSKLPSSLPSLESSRLIDQVRERVRYLHYSIRTEQAYVHWIKAFVHFHGLRHPSDLGAPEVEAFLSWLASERKVAVATHKQALSALVFLDQKVLGADLPWLDEIGRPKSRAR